jgi:ABC-type phosphate transport system substrate-binding protein
MKASFKNLLLGILLTGFAMVGQAAEVAIIVNRNNPVDELSFKELRALFELQQQFWKNGERVSLVTQKAGLPEKQVVLETVYHRSEDSLNRYWMNRMFKAEISTIPKPRTSNNAVKQVISRLPNGIGFIDISAVDSSIKVLRIDGRLPGEAGYELASQ